MGGYAIAPGPFDLGTFIACSAGTGLVSASANAVNQSMEVPFDAQMARTKNRVLVRGLLAWVYFILHFTKFTKSLKLIDNLFFFFFPYRPEHAIAFAAISGIAGISLLAYNVNTLTAILGGANLILYTSIYTPMKRFTILNTWVGSVGKSKIPDRYNLIIISYIMSYKV